MSGLLSHQTISPEWIEIHLAVGVSCRRHLLSRRASESLGEHLVLAYARQGVYVGHLDAAYGRVRLIVSTPPWKRATHLLRRTRLLAQHYVRRHPRFFGRKVKQLLVWTEPARAEVRAASGRARADSGYCALAS
jgi:hypothetical protein